MDEVKELQNAMVEANNFVKELDESIREPAFERILSKILQEKKEEEGASPGGQPANTLFGKISKDSGIPVERLQEVYEEKEGRIEVITTSIPSSSQAQQTKNITLLCVYGNKIGFNRIKIPKAVVVGNLDTLGISYYGSRARDMKSTRGINDVTGDMLMLNDEGRENAISLLKGILRIS